MRIDPNRQELDYRRSFVHAQYLVARLAPNAAYRPNSLRRASITQRPLWRAKPVEATFALTAHRFADRVIVA
jgi:hypothetical protein